MQYIYIGLSVLPISVCADWHSSTVAWPGRQCHPLAEIFNKQQRLPHILVDWSRTHTAHGSTQPHIHRFSWPVREIKGYLPEYLYIICFQYIEYIYKQNTARYHSFIHDANYISIWLILMLTKPHSFASYCKFLLDLENPESNISSGVDLPRKHDDIYVYICVYYNNNRTTTQQQPELEMR